jgi:hypothetical protein
MKDQMRKNLARLANHLDLGGFEKFADEIDEIMLEDVSEEDELVIEEGLDPLDIVSVAKEICDEINEMIENYGADIDEVISDLEYKDIGKETMTLEDMLSDAIISFDETISEDQVEDVVELILSKYDFIGHLKDDSFDELCQEIEDEMLELE